jgi:hypothetical protein
MYGHGSSPVGTPSSAAPIRANENTYLTSCAGSGVTSIIAMLDDRPHVVSGRFSFLSFV